MRYKRPNSGQKWQADKDGHPLTGSSKHFALNDVFHQGNSKDQTDVLRKLAFVPELAGFINSQCAEQLFSGMRKNNYFLNNLQRNILHHYNMDKNQKVIDQNSKIVPSDVAMQCDSHGRVVGMLLNISAHLLSSSTFDDNVCDIVFYSLLPISWNANRISWQQ